MLGVFMSKIQVTKHYGQADFETLIKNIIHHKLEQISIKEKKQQTIISNQIISSNLKRGEEK